VRLPWLQIDADGQTRARMLARLLGVPEPQGLGIALALWTWALEMAGDGDFSGTVAGDAELVAAAVSWPADDAKRLLEQLQRVGFVATSPDLRVRGLDRYRPTWEKNRRKGHGRDKSADSGVTRAGPARDPLVSRRNPERKTETETDIETNNLVLVEVEPTTPPATVEVFEHWKRATSKPRAVLDDDRRSLIERRLAEGHAVEDLKAAIDGYAKSPWHNGENDRRKKYLNLELMLRDAEHIEQGLDLLLEANVVTPKSESRAL
jgi:hypothetical protein